MLNDPEPDQLFFGFFFWSVCALLGALVTAGVAFTLRRFGVHLLPPQRQRDVPWTGYELFGVAAVHILAQAFAGSFLVASGLLVQIYGPDSLANFESAKGDAANRVGLWSMVVSFPLQLAGILLLLRAASGTRPYQLGLTTHRAGFNVLIGVLSWASVTPLVLALNELVSVAYKHWLEGPPEPHMLEELVKGNPLPVEWGLVFFTAIVAAPIMEELMFRGVLLRWATVLPTGADVIMGFCVLIAVAARMDTIQDAMRLDDWSALQLELQPMVFALVALFGYLWVRVAWQSTVAGGICASALLFALVHPNWPTPIPLFALGLYLGWLSYRTQSLIPSMVMHALFNSIACAELLAKP
ncbi:MAG: CPBP family intramembrane metalloprotease [Gemmataceae bacterium]|nr:CPBP family intramembrane metalloprotease [Gemmataceae bacterium]